MRAEITVIESVGAEDLECFRRQHSKLWYAATATALGQQAQLKAIWNKGVNEQMQEKDIPNRYMSN